VVSVEGSQCQGSPSASSVSVTAAFSRGNTTPFATLALPNRGSAYAFRMAFTVPASIQTPTGTRFLLQGDRVTFTTSGGACRASPFQVT
jgi:hypothetical protein